MEKLPVIVVGFILLVILVFGFYPQRTTTLVVKVQGWKLDFLKPRGYNRVFVTDVGNFPSDDLLGPHLSVGKCYKAEINTSFLLGSVITSASQVSCR